MAELSYIVSALLTGIVLVALVAMLARAREWRSAPTGVGRDFGARADGSVTEMVVEIARTPLAWTVGFVVLVFVFGTAALAFVAGTVPTAIAQAAGVAVVLLFASAFGAYLFWGVYHSARTRDLPDAQATLAGLWALGLFLIIAIVINLVMAG